MKKRERGRRRVGRKGETQSLREKQGRKEKGKERKKKGKKERRKGNKRKKKERGKDGRL